MNFVISASKNRLLRRSSLFLRRLHAVSQPQSPQPNDEVDEATVTQAIEFLQKTPHQNWASSQFLQTLISSSRRLPSDSDALNFIQHSSQLQITGSLNSVLQRMCELEFGCREYTDCLSELYQLCKEWKVPITEYNAAELDDVDRWVLLYIELDPSLKSTNLRNEFIRALILGERVFDARKVLDEMLQPESEVKPDQKTLDISLHLLKNPEYNSYSSRFRRNTLDTFHTLNPSLLSNDGTVELVLQFARFSIYPQDYEMHDLVTTLCDEGKIVKACAFLDELMKLHAPSDTIESCFELIRDEIRNLIRNASRDRAGYLDSSFPHERKKEEMNKLLTEMKGSKICPSNKTVQLFLDQLFELKMVDEVMDLFEWFRERNESVDADTYDSFVRGKKTEKEKEK